MDQNEEKKVVETTVEVETTASAEAQEESKQPNEVTELLTKYGMGADEVAKIVEQYGIETVEDIAILTESDLVEAGMKLIKARKLVVALKTTTAEPSPTAASTTPQPTIMADYGSILPNVPSDESWLSSLKAGGVLKVETESYISAIRVVFAEQAGIYDLPEKIAKAMETYADEADEPVPKEFYKVRESITRHNYGEIFSAIEGLNGSYVTEARRKEFLRRIRTELQPEIKNAWHALDGYYESLRATNSDPGMMLQAITGIMSGTGAVGAALPPFDAVMDASESLKDTINHVFRGVGLAVATAMAYDARQTSSLLENSQLPAMIGVANRDQMLKKLGANITPNYVRQEANMVRFVLSLIKFSDNIAAGDEAKYLTALWQLGKQLNWDLFGGNDGMKSLGGSQVL